MYPFKHQRAAVTPNNSRSCNANFHKWLLNYPNKPQATNSNCDSSIRSINYNSFNRDLPFDFRQQQSPNPLLLAVPMCGSRKLKEQKGQRLCAYTCMTPHNHVWGECVSTNLAGWLNKLTKQQASHLKRTKRIVELYIQICISKAAAVYNVATTTRR